MPTTICAANPPFNELQIERADSITKPSAFMFRTGGAFRNGTVHAEPANENGPNRLDG